MLTSQEASQNDSVSVAMYNGGLLRLLAVRASLTDDPAPELPPIDGLSSDIGGTVASTKDLTILWRSHWDAVLSELILPKATVPIDGWAPWPAALPDVDADTVSAWRKTMPTTKRGTPLLERPSYRYYLAQVASGYELPGRLVVLPFHGHFSYRYSKAIGLVSAPRFFDVSDPTYGLRAA